MTRSLDIVLADLRHQIGELGGGGGLISPSVYDTAQVTRLAPQSCDIWPALNWLLEQQQPDGGWGNPALPLARDLPTLAAVLAIAPHASRSATAGAVAAGLAFLRRQMGHWAAPLADDIPVGVELLLPRLVEEAVTAGLDLPASPYAALAELGRQRRALVAGRPLRAGTTPAHSWEGLAREPERAVIDGTGGIGHSPAATAAWLRAADGRAELADLVAGARGYLARSATATATGIPGVHPTVWPIDRFELDFGLYALLLADVLRLPALRDVVAPRVECLAAGVREAGLGMSDHFMVDGDITATAMAVLTADGRPVDAGLLDRFAAGDHFFTYPGELQPSITTTAHAVHALALIGRVPGRAVRYLLAQQTPDGRWDGDKWHGSWLYTTAQVGLALLAAGVCDGLDAAEAALRAHQRPGGGWGVGAVTSEETAHAVLLLRALATAGILSAAGRRALLAGERSLRANYVPLGERECDAWIGKELYVPRRVSRMVELAALLSAEVHAAQGMAMEAVDAVR